MTTHRRLRWRILLLLITRHRGAGRDRRLGLGLGRERWLRWRRRLRGGVCTRTSRRSVFQKGCRRGWFLIRPRWCRRLGADLRGQRSRRWWRRGRQPRRSLLLSWCWRRGCCSADWARGLGVQLVGRQRSGVEMLRERGLGGRRASYSSWGERVLLRLWGRGRG